jgi:hypothetical protein
VAENGTEGNQTSEAGAPENIKFKENNGKFCLMETSNSTKETTVYTYTVASRFASRLTDN